jgi:tellurite resistance protein TerC
MIITAARKIAIALMGGTVLLIGVIMIVTPGPAIVVIPLGLAILATEFAWARRYKEKLEEKWQALRNRRKKVVE